MTELWRFLQTGYQDAFTNMAIDRAILEAHREGLVPPTLRVYGWTPPAISIGYFQGMNEEVDVQACHKQGVDCVRRITGGGAVFHDKELTYSVVVSESHPMIPHNILESYARICGALVRGLDGLGIQSSFVPINDIVVGSQKISGNAQTRKQGVVLQHGTILLDVDVEMMFTLLQVPNEKIKDKLISDVRQRVTSCSRVLGRPVSFDDVSRNIRHGFEQTFSVQLCEGTLNAKERDWTDKYRREIFNQHAWNYKR
jgi:lipoate-protein ligase A